MKIKSAVFDLSAPDLKSCPASALPEFAFIGRSNVGKSSLINMLSGQRELAKVSDMPGKTKLINFFLINDSWHLVDLPGYGYAKAAKADRNEFNKAVGDYLEKRRNVSCVFVLIDSRIPPQQIDLEFLDWLGDCSVPFVLVFTKTDKQSASASQQNIELFKKTMSESWDELPDTFISSSKTKAGRSEILGFIQQNLENQNRA
ncbi:MAG TPA: ribosome biogenesis GTP-binding protein YihA/YsxC [Opitutaceae bacterium]|nr:ribosome biogenesis GTP-binding protein YihA/YsxC [Opitutaceae bacterium]